MFHSHITKVFGIFVLKCSLILDFSPFEQVSLYHLLLGAFGLGCSGKTSSSASPKWLFMYRFLPALGSKMKN